MKFKEFHLKDARALHFKNPMLKRLITFATTGGKSWEQSSETLSILRANSSIVFITTA